MMKTKDEFRTIGGYDGEPWNFYRVTRGTDFDVAPWEWFMEASPFANGEPHQILTDWGHTWQAYNAWAFSVGRPPATFDDLARGGASDFLPELVALVSTWPVWQVAEADLSGWKKRDLVEHLALHQMLRTIGGYAPLPVEQALASELNERLGRG